MNYRKIGTRIKQFFQSDWVHRNRKKSKIIGDLKKCKRIFYKDTFYDISTSSFIKEDIDIKDGIRLLLLENIVGKSHFCRTSKGNYFIYNTFYDGRANIVPMEEKAAKNWLLEFYPSTYEKLFGELKEM
ncbi:hypothetical protein [Pectinatus frisingensis]|uniref:hypothetical protein n=1 Tax=Pectinatus frisingensis TaxID=865 RepID=UPI003D806D80